MRKVLVVLMVLFGQFAASAQEIEVDGIRYRIDSSGNAAVIYNDGYEGDVFIPSKFSYESKEYNVYCIKSDAFQCNRKITSISIPSSITRIESDAFYYCTRLHAVYITDLKAWCNIDFQCHLSEWANPLSYAHHLFLNGEELTNLVIPEGITEIYKYSFVNCEGVESISIPSGVTEIGDHAFTGCKNVSSIILPSSLIKIGYYAFSGLNIKELNIPEGVTDIGEHAFSECESLSSIVLPNSIVEIGMSAFYGCKKLISVKLPFNLKKINWWVFSRCSSLKSIDLPESIYCIGDYAFSGCSSLTSITFPENVIYIGHEAFFDCSGLNDVYCYNWDVPSTAQTAFIYMLIQNATLHVPAESVDLYKSEYPWNSFKSIVPLETSGLNSVNFDTKNNNSYYKLNGTKLEGTPREKGFYINNGKKILIK